MDDFDPDEHPVRCNNCRNAVVYGSPEEPMARCAAGHGRPCHVYYLIRPKHPRAFAAAATCPDFQSMSEPVDREHGTKTLRIYGVDKRVPADVPSARTGEKEECYEYSTTCQGQ